MKGVPHALKKPASFIERGRAFYHAGQREGNAGAVDSRQPLFLWLWQGEGRNERDESDQGDHVEGRLQTIHVADLSEKRCGDATDADGKAERDPRGEADAVWQVLLAQDDHRTIGKIQSRTEDDETEDTENGAVRPCENERSGECEEEAEADEGAIAMLVAHFSADQCKECADAIVYAEEQVAEIL